MERIRICDIAEELGVSTATVSNVIHGKTHKVSSETVQRVQELLEKRQYIPSMAGILLAQNDSRIIGIVVNDHKKYESHVLEDPFIAASLNALSSEIDRAGQFMMVKATTKADDIIRFASMWNLDGMVLIGFCEEDYQLLRNHMRIPFVAYDGFFEHPKGICNLTIDNYDGGFQVGQHFKALGHQRALCIADNNICMDKERWEGFHTAFPNADFWQIPMGQSQRRRFYCEHLEALKRYTAVFAVSDYYAIDLMQFLGSQGISVPKQISVAGFDDAPICRQIVPTLTSVRQDSPLRAKLALERLRDMKVGKEEGSTIRLPVTLIVRESTCTAPNT